MLKNLVILNLKLRKYSKFPKTHLSNPNKLKKSINLPFPVTYKADLSIKLKVYIQSPSL